MSIHVWQRAEIASDGTHHLLDGKPLYVTRFDEVLKYHEPGLAPAKNDTGAFHIGVEGRPAYDKRFRRTFGFYENLAAADSGQGWTHVHPDGTPLTTTRYAWCGNFQGGKCTVRGEDGLYHHIDGDGQPLYDERYLYAGDYRDGIAVARRASDAMCIHVDDKGEELNDRSFLDLDIFHKGYARARDDRGWFHVRANGRQAYEIRFAVVEPFYNGVALCETLGGERVLLSESGKVLRTICSLGAAAEEGPGGRQ
jgi:hypothetical protein